MVTPQLSAVLKAYGLSPDKYRWAKLGTGHIHQTFLLQAVSTADVKGSFVLQQINTMVFRSPLQLMNNWIYSADYLTRNAPTYYFLRPIPGLSGELIIQVEVAEKKMQYWRLTPFMEGRVYETVEKPEQAFEAAASFAKFTKFMSGADTNRFVEVLPGFHDANLRWKQLLLAEKWTKNERLAYAADALCQLKAAAWIVEQAARLEKHLPKRIQHMDAKMSNVLFPNGLNKQAVLLDLDTIMPATVLSDIGDMIRSMTASVSENESDISKVYLRKDVYEAIKQAYMSEMSKGLTQVEIDNFKFAGQKMIHMQAVRFLTDYLNGDVYYPTQTAHQNLYRCLNQLALLDSLSRIK
ncbi:MAG: aminoglycoside phosphotransferase family protein [Bacteroidetes bacterium]|jgi:hypothetical protein|nr:aminoglycoside phosphotransferase family protein [Bacteroidota bacterium]